jgi:hypothetical protein
MVSASSSLTLLRTTISSDSASGAGGGVDMGPSGALFSMTDSTLSNDTASSGGGFGGTGNFSMLRSTISGNSATGSAGGIRLYVGAANTIEIDNSTVSSNTATTTGGGIQFFTMSATSIVNMYNSTIYNNKAGTAGGGGGIDRSTTVNGTFTIESTIVAGNSASGTANDMNYATSNQSIAGNNDLIGASDVGNFTLAGNNMLTGTSGAPLNPKLGNLANNGGATLTNMVLPGSPALDNGTNVDTFASDQRGTGGVSPPAYPRQVGSAPDIGAVERQVGAPVATITPLVNVFPSNAATSDPYVITVTYDGDYNINYSKLDNNDILVTGPNGFSKLATFVSAVPANNATEIVATYQFAAPVNAAAGWDVSDEGTYTVSMQSNQVYDMAPTPLAVPASTLGAFTVNLSLFTVKNTNDSGDGSLRQAIINAEANPGNTVTFSNNTNNGNTNFFTGSNTITLLSQLPAWTGTQVIQGPGANHLKITSGFTGSLIPSSTGSTVTISGVTISGLTNTGASGYYYGTLSGNTWTFDSCSITGNAGGSFGGGFIYGNSGSSNFTLNVTNSTISGNSTGGNGGFFYEYNSTSNITLNFKNDTITKNTATDNYSTLYTAGGGFISEYAGAMTVNIEGCTIADNSTGTQGGAIGWHDAANIINIHNSIISQNIQAGSTTSATADIGSTNGSVATVNVNYSAIGTAGGAAPAVPINGSNNILDTDLLLPASPMLANNGGPMLTILPAANSPVVDAGDPAGDTLIAPTPTLDQRGANRVAGAAIDLGAVEVQATAPVVTGFTVNNGNAQRSRITTITVNFQSPVDASQFQAAGAITLTRTAGGPSVVVNTSNGLIVSPASGTVSSITLTFSNTLITGSVEYASLADGYWQLAVVPASFSSTAGDTTLRRFFGDINADGTIDGVDFASFGGQFGTTPGPNVSGFDYNNDGTIDGTDFGQFGNRFGHTL